MRIRLILLLLLFCKLFQFSGELLDSLIYGKLAVHRRDQEITDWRESRATDTKDRERWFKIDIPGSLSAVFVVWCHLLVGLTLLNRKIGWDMPAACPGHLFNHIGNEFQSRSDFLWCRRSFLIVRYRQLMRIRPGFLIVEKLWKCCNAVIKREFAPFFRSTMVGTSQLPLIMKTARPAENNATMDE